MTHKLLIDVHTKARFNALLSLLRGRLASRLSRCMYVFVNRISNKQTTSETKQDTFCTAWATRFGRPYAQRELCVPLKAVKPPGLVTNHGSFESNSNASVLPVSNKHGGHNNVGFLVTRSCTKVAFYALFALFCACMEDTFVVQHVYVCVYIYIIPPVTQISALIVVSFMYLYTHQNWLYIVTIKP